VPGRTDMLQKLIDKKDKMVLPGISNTDAPSPSTSGQPLNPFLPSLEMLWCRTWRTVSPWRRR